MQLSGESLVDQVTHTLPMYELPYLDYNSIGATENFNYNYLRIIKIQFI